MTYQRLVAMFGFFLLLFAVVHIKLFTVSANTGYAQAAQQQSSVLLQLPKERGDIYDCNGTKLTGTEKIYYAISSPGGEQYSQLYPYVAEKDRAALYENAGGRRPFCIQVNAYLSNFQIVTAHARYMPLPIAVHTIGYLDGEGEGVTGIERAFNDILKEGGVETTLRCVANAAGQLAEGYEAEVEKNSPSQKGVELTLDSGIQRMCEGIGAENIQKGSIVVLECSTGKIKAMVSCPTFDPLDVGSALSQEDGPLLNRSISAFNVGSVFKPLVAAAALEQGVDPLEEYTCTGSIEIGGHTYRCANGRSHGTVNMQGALEHSCNCYFIHLLNGKGAGRLYELCTECGLGAESRFAPGYAGSAGSLPSPEQLKNLGELSSFAFGQGKLLATPVQVAGYMNMLANKGVYCTPSLVEGVLDETTGSLTPVISGPEPARAVSEKTAESVRQMLSSVVEAGLGWRGQPQHLKAAGKTGTAQTGRFKTSGAEIYDAWFGGYYPAENPKYTIVVCLEDGGESGETAAPIFAKVCDGLYRLGLVGAA